MRNHFICPHYRHWLASRPETALNHFFEAQDTACYYRERGLWQEAASHLGKAYELAELLLTCHVNSPAKGIEAFTCSAVLLADNYRKLFDHQACQRVCVQAQQRLLAETSLHLQNPITQKLLQACVQALEAGSNAPLAYTAANSQTMPPATVH